MSLTLIKFQNEYMGLLETWESTNDLDKYLSHSRPEYLRETSSTKEETTLFLLIQQNNINIGAIWLEDITDSDAKLGIYIAEEECRGKGIGKEAINILKNIAFADMNLKKLYLNVRETNTRAIKCYEHCGFKITKKYPKSHFTDNSFQGAYQMTLLNTMVQVQ